MKIHRLRSRWPALFIAAFACLTGCAATNLLTDINESGPVSLLQAIPTAKVSSHVPDAIHQERSTVNHQTKA